MNEVYLNIIKKINKTAAKICNVTISWKAVEIMVKAQTTDKIISKSFFRTPSLLHLWEEKGNISIVTSCHEAP